MKIYKSIVDERILHDFSKIQGRSLMNHVANSYDIETAISFASLFCPEMIVYLFLSSIMEISWN